VLSAGLYTSVYPEDANPAGSSDHSQKKSERGPSNFCSPLAAFSERCFGALKRGASARDKELFTLASTAIILKLVVMPLICFPLTWLFMRTGLLGQDHLMHLILLIESAVPSSQSVVSLVQVEAGSRCANRISGLYLPMYITSAFTLSVAVAMAIFIIG